MAARYGGIFGRQRRYKWRVRLIQELEDIPLLAGS